MDISKPRRDTIKRALIVYQTVLLGKKYENIIPITDAQKEIATAKDIIDDLNMLDSLDECEPKIPTGPELEQFIKEETEQFIEDVKFSDMEIKPVSKNANN